MDCQIYLEAEKHEQDIQLEPEAYNQSKENNNGFVNILDYGAKGDGETDDTQAIQNAINYASTMNMGVFIPVGIFIVSPDTGLSIPSNMVILGAGFDSVIKVSPQSDVQGNIIKAEDSDMVLLSNFCVDGNRANQSQLDTVACHYGVYLSSSNNSKVENVTVHDMTGVGVHVYNCSGVVVSNCTSYNNNYHGFECEQCSGTVWIGNNGVHNERHGIFISPGEVGGTGSIGNVVSNNNFSKNNQYGVAFGIDAAGGSIGLTKNNQICNNTIQENAEYGISVYTVDDALLSGNLVLNNGFFGIYLFKSQRCQITNNRLSGNSRSANGAYDEILLEGASSGKGSYLNTLAYNYIIMDGTVKARYGIREATDGDGPNIVINNIIPYSGTSGYVQISHPNTKTSIFSEVPIDNTESLRRFDKGIAVGANAALPSGAMGMDAPFGNSVVRVYSDVGGVQLVSAHGSVDIYANGSNAMTLTGQMIDVHNFRISNLPDAISSSDAVNLGQVQSLIRAAIADMVQANKE